MGLLAVSYKSVCVKEQPVVSKQLNNSKAEEPTHSLGLKWG